MTKIQRMAMAVLIVAAGSLAACNQAQAPSQRDVLLAPPHAGELAEFEDVPRRSYAVADASYSGRRMKWEGPRFEPIEMSPADRQVVTRGQPQQFNWSEFYAPDPQQQNPLISRDTMHRRPGTVPRSPIVGINGDHRQTNPSAGKPVGAGVTTASRTVGSDGVAAAAAGGRGEIGSHGIGSDGPPIRTVKPMERRR